MKLPYVVNGISRIGGRERVALHKPSLLCDKALKCRIDQIASRRYQLFTTLVARNA